MENWTDIHKDFAKEYYYCYGDTYQQCWEAWGLTYQDAQEWIPVGFEPRDYDEVKKWKDYNFTLQQTQSWIKAGLTPYDAEFAAYLRLKNYQPNQSLNLEQLEKEFDAWEYKNKPAQEYLDIIFPKNQRNTFKKLDISSKNFTSNLDLRDFINLEELNCAGNQLTTLNITNCQQLKRLDCRNNNLSGDLSLFSHLVNLESLWISNNHFTGSLKPLQSLTKLEYLSIKDTDIDSGLEYLPDSLEEFDCSTDKRKEAKCQVIDKLLKSMEGKNFPQKLQEYKHGLCPKCHYPYIEKFLNEAWCSSCNPIKKDIKKLIKELKIIPYNDFTNIKHLADGGFSKVYKAEWHGKWVALKSLSHSRDIKVDFLQEISYHKLINSNSVVKCHGISQDPQTKDYIMVMDYIKDGDLRQYLDKNYNKLNIKNKLYKLYTIASGLNSIHQQGLIHRDFHAGNVLNSGDGRYCQTHSYITDLGLCRPANRRKDDKIYGVMPYVAPEVLNSKVYSQTSDIYSFGILAAEIITGLPPYYELPHSLGLAIKICEGLRPNLDTTQAPQLLKDLIKKCWDANPLQRPVASELAKTLNDWYNGKNAEFNNQCKEFRALSKTTNTSLKYKLHPSAIYTSRLLDTKNLPEPRNSQEINDQFYKSKELCGSSSIDMASLLDNLPNTSLEENQQLEQQDLQIQPTYGTPGSSKNN
ncbi:MAG: hypothetical protein MRECE_23c007 [Mycoplasmataceae bacterium CE_OT135]|nr:MAG: hypothetical protein MRECE_23c007 [Mycoplasmataceae bacterium CE_OT135]